MSLVKINKQQVELTPIDKNYTSQSEMIEDQLNQFVDFIYSDGENFWQYLGTTSGVYSHAEGCETIANGLTSLSSGSITVNTNKVTSNSLIFLTPQNSITGVVYISSRTAGVSFTIQSTQSDNSDIAWFIIQPST
jgi:hypothetical protein